MPQLCRPGVGLWGRPFLVAGGRTLGRVCQRCMTGMGASWSGMVGVNLTNRQLSRAFLSGYAYRKGCDFG